MSKALNTTSTIFRCNHCDITFKNQRSLNTHYSRFNERHQLIAHESAQVVQQSELPVLNIGKPTLPVDKKRKLDHFVFPRKRSEYLDQQYSKILRQYDELVEDQKDLHKKYVSVCKELHEQCSQITRQEQIITGQVEVITEQGKMLREFRKRVVIHGTPENPFPAFPVPSPVNVTPLPKFFSPSQLLVTPAPPVVYDLDSLSSSYSPTSPL